MHFFHMTYEDVLSLPISKYGMLLNQSLNIGNLYRQGKFELQTPEDKYKQLRKEVELYKQFKEYQLGKING